MRSNKLLVILSTSILFLGGQAAYAKNEVTSIQIVNNTDTDLRVSKLNLSGTLKTLNNPLLAHTTNTLTSTTSNVSDDTGTDGGVITYVDSCNVSWEKVKILGGPYTFTTTSHPSSTSSKYRCTAQQIIANSLTGEYKVKFILEK